MEAVGMNNPLTLKLEHFACFTDADRRRLDELISMRRRTYMPHATILADGDTTSDILVVLSGMAVRYKDLADGGRQIMAFLLPGDLCDVEVFVLERMDHSIGAITKTEVAIIPGATMRTLLTDMQGLTQALWWSTMTDSAVLRERIIDHGRRDARQRLAHLFYELLVRYRMIGMAADNNYPLALTQEELAEATGLTSVHVNRMIQSLRAEGLIEHRHKTLTVLDPAGLKQAARFEAAYLHLTRAEEGCGPVAQRTRDLI
jgi:CRP-like cAMP-binding protein